ncbi:hypothetical protein DSO57_1005906 [Entomophthora muscae]|uniref:Uncharacterized protein n=1 Tax=Entomophthora muscae TaxID=34485 RepID=A0ACC2S9P3_9FUNG|nr:hypothetical protein DSO57_1005906 [Entomophthora muscae]
MNKDAGGQNLANGGARVTGEGARSVRRRQVMDGEFFWLLQESLAVQKQDPLLGIGSIYEQEIGLKHESKSSASGGEMQGLIRSSSLIGQGYA